jgi:hypothetical protein
MQSVSTIAIGRDTRDMLKELGHKGQTYDQLIKELIKSKRSVHKQDSFGWIESLQPNEGLEPIGDGPYESRNLI